MDGDEEHPDTSNFTKTTIRSFHDSASTRLGSLNGNDYDEVHLDFLLDEYLFGDLANLVNSNASTRHIVVPKFCDIDINQCSEKHITFFFHSSELDSESVKSKKKLIDISSEVPNLVLRIVDLDLDFQAFKRFDWTNLFNSSSKVISITRNPLTNSFLIDHCSKNKIEFHAWEDARISPLRFSDNSLLKSHSYLANPANTASTRSQLNTLLLKDSTPEHSVDCGVNAGIDELSRFNGLIAALSSKFEKYNNPMFTRSSYGFLQQLVLGNIREFSSSGDLDEGTGTFIEETVLNDMHRIENSHLLFYFLIQHSLTDDGLNNKIEQNLKVFIENDAHKKNESFLKVSSNFLNPLFCYSILDKHYLDHSMAFLLNLSKYLKKDFLLNHKPESRQWLFFCNTVLNNSKEVSSLIKEVPKEEIHSLRPIFIYCSFLSTFLNHEKCYDLYSEVIGFQSNNATGIPALYHEVMQSISFLLRKEKKETIRILEKVKSIDPRIFLKKYSNDWINIEYMLHKLSDSSINSDASNFLRKKAEGNIYKNIFASSFDAKVQDLPLIDLSAFHFRD